MSRFAVMHIGYGNHNGNKETLLVPYDMAFYSFNLFIPVNTVQGSIVTPFNALTVHDADTWLHTLTVLHSDVSRNFSNNKSKFN